MMNIPKQIAAFGQFGYWSMTGPADVGPKAVLSAGCFPPWLPKLCDGALESDHGGFIDVQTELKFINGVGIEKEEIVVCVLLLLYCWSSSDVWWRGHLAPFVWRICGRVQLGRGELKSQSSI